MRQGVIDLRHQPDALPLFTDIIHQAAGTVGSSDRRFVAQIVVDDIQVFGQALGIVKRVIVQHDRAAVMGQIAEQITDIFVVQRQFRLHRPDRHAEERIAQADRQIRARVVGRAVRDDATVQRHAADNPIAVGIEQIEGFFLRNPHQRILPRLLVFGFDADVIDLVVAQSLIGENHRFGSAGITRHADARWKIAPDGFGDRLVAQVGQFRVARDIEIDIRFAIAGPGKIRRQKGDESHVGAVGKA